MYVNLGNDAPIEGYRDSESDDPELVRYRHIGGQRVTSVVFPEGITLTEAVTTTMAVMQAHFESGAVPAWIESDSDSLCTMLIEQFGLTKAKAKRPKSWGDDDARAYLDEVTATHRKDEG